jgi:molybdenum cofactor guanylyltransferase
MERIGVTLSEGASERKKERNVLKREEIIGVILAGGQSRRFGQPKAFAKRRGVPFYQYSIEALKPFTSKLVVVTNENVQNQFYADNSLTLIQDDLIFKGKGPLAGIYSAMKEFQAEWYIVLPIDVPFINNHVIKQLIASMDNGVEAVVPVMEGRKQPLIAAYHYSIQNKIQDILQQEDLSLHSLLQRINCLYVSDIGNSQSFININRPEDYRLYILSQE